MKISHSIEIDAPPHDVFARLKDTDATPDWIADVVEAELLEETDDGVGSRIRHVVDRGTRVEVEGRITVYDPPQRLRLELANKQLDLDLDFTLDPLDGGDRTRLTHEASVRIKGMFAIAAKALAGTIERETRKAVERDLATLKNLIEQ